MVSTICGSMLLLGKQDTETLQEAVNELNRLNPALRTRIVETEAGTMQTVGDYMPKNIAVLRFSDRSELDAYARDYARKPLDLCGQLCEINVVLLPRQYGLLVKLHHIISDAWTLALIGSQYNAILTGETPSVYSYTDHLNGEDTYLKSERYAKDKAFFLNQFQKCEEVTYLLEKQSTSFSAQRKTFLLDGTKTRQLTDYAKVHDSSAFVLFMTALATYMSRVKQNAEKFYIGTAVLNRSGIRERNTMGMFVNTVPLLMELDSKQTFSHNLAEVKATAISAFRHQKFNYGDVLSTVRQEYGFGEKLYDVMLSYQNATIAGGTDGMESTWYHSGVQTESLQIHIDDRDSEGIFRVHFDYQTDKFTEHEIERMYGHIINLLFDAIGNDNKPLYELEILSVDEKQKLLHDFNDTAADYSREKCVHQLFEERVEKIPEKTAVIACDRTLTYGELNKQANRIANGLIEQGVKLGDIVAFMLPRRSYLIAAMFGILKAGAAYLPIDPDYPKDRIDYILEDSKAACFITEEKITELLENADSGKPCVAVSSNSSSYCIYTSGTTGAPKGAVIRHRNLVNFCSDNIYNNLQHSIAQNCTSVLACGSIIFDISNSEIILSLLLNKSVVLANETELFDANLLADLMSRNRVDCVHCTPTKLRTYLSNPKFASSLSNVKCIMVGGEPLTTDVYTLITECSQAFIFNGYGPTETTIGVSYGQEYQSGITIGKPIANTQIYIVDRYMQPVPIGVTGELCIAGDSVGAGYCIYTSGSTGNPKGTLLVHQGIVNLTTYLDLYSNLSNCKQFGFMTTITFDVATQEILTALLNGFTGVLMPERKETTPDKIIKGIVDNQIDIMFATPSYFDTLTNTDEKCERLFSSIKVVCLAGEAFYLNSNAQKYMEQANVTFENQYGPAETHVISAATSISIDDISIGKPIANTQIYILDRYMQPVPIGVTGELCIAGDGVGAGYLNRPELTAEKFIGNPFGNGKLYKTGDLAYWREDGNIVYVGRNDFQVKIRGLRIELGEIENAIQGVEGILQAVVTVRKAEDGRQLICAFYTGQETDGKALRATIGQKLGKYPDILSRNEESVLLKENMEKLMTHLKKFMENF